VSLYVRFGRLCHVLSIPICYTECMTTSYADQYRDVDFRRNPDKYVIGRGEQGVLIAEPYKSEILPLWKFKTPDIAEESAAKIYALFLEYGKKNEFVGMDMARKFLQMGFTRSRRYANHPSGRKYNEDGTKREQSPDWETSPKAQSAKIFKHYLDTANRNETYLALKKKHEQD